MFRDFIKKRNVRQGLSKIPDLLENKSRLANNNGTCIMRNGLEYSFNKGDNNAKKMSLWDTAATEH